eukprot:CAMPEP_0197599336 /NCGR_PEP_ID=MMETSP1326-20131121/31171_1 /TAXON_ID=1155430 /ORGANISM="Genus nov. species nov., Strain RCC2288" /LENGTH=31 /DNA_ID= /DNA_START= /DNA_END= /DNA_ORIENTATION=
MSGKPGGLKLTFRLGAAKPKAPEEGGAAAAA